MVQKLVFSSSLVIVPRWGTLDDPWIKASLVRAPITIAQITAASWFLKPIRPITLLRLQLLLNIYLNLLFDEVHALIRLHNVIVRVQPGHVIRFVFDIKNQLIRCIRIGIQKSIQNCFLVISISSYRYRGCKCRDDDFAQPISLSFLCIMITPLDLREGLAQSARTLLSLCIESLYLILIKIVKFSVAWQLIL